MVTQSPRRGASIIFPRRAKVGRWHGSMRRGGEAEVRMRDAERRRKREKRRFLGGERNSGERKE